VEQAFREVSLADLTKAPEILQSMTASLDGDVAKISKVQQQISDLSAQMEQSNKALKEVTKIHRAMCMKASAAETSGN
jgi:chaperonin cofactor prefoldin